MKSIFSIAICVLLMVIAVSAQHQSPRGVPGGTLNSGEPSVFITFERSGGTPPRTGPKRPASEMVTLRLRNNSPWAIAISADGDFTPATLNSITLADGGKVFALPNGSHVEVCYEAEVIPTMSVEEYTRVKVPNQIPSAYSCKWTARRASSANAWVQPGNSINFSLPKDFIGRGLKVYTVFSYEWEADHGQLKADEPTHQVYFYSTDLTR